MEPVELTHIFGDAGNSLFDATQYEFFSQKAVEEVELGGLEDDKDDLSLAPVHTDEYQLFDRDEVLPSAVILIVYVHLYEFDVCSFFICSLLS